MQDGIKNRMQDGTLVSFGILHPALLFESFALWAEPRSWVQYITALLLTISPMF